MSQISEPTKWMTKAVKETKELAGKGSGSWKNIKCEMIENVHCTEVESRVKEIIVALLDKPLKNMALNEELLSKYGETARRNVRRVHEMEYIVQKF